MIIRLSKRKKTISKHFANAKDYNQYATVQAQVCDLLITKICQNQQANILEIGAGLGQLTQRLKKQINAENWHINELCSEHAPKLQKIIPQAQLHLGDAENLLLKELLNDKFNLIISANTVQWFDNPLFFIKNSYKNLQNGGQLLFNTFTENNLFEIKQLTNKGLNYPTKKQWFNELKKYNFKVLEISTHQYQLTFDTPYNVLKHVQKTGVSVNDTDNQDNFVWTRSSLKAFEEEYRRLFTDEIGNVSLTYEVLLISACK